MEVKLTTEVRDKEVRLSVSQSYKTQTRGCLIEKRAYESLPTL